MRTTLSLDDDVAAQLLELRSRRGRPFKQLVNDALRLGLTELDREGAAPPAGPYTRPATLGRPRLPSVDDVSEALAMAEDDNR
jgi:hypothetical protein